MVVGLSCGINITVFSVGNAGLSGTGDTATIASVKCNGVRGLQVNACGKVPVISSYSNGKVKDFLTLDDINFTIVRPVIAESPAIETISRYFDIEKGTFY